MSNKKFLAIDFILIVGFIIGLFNPPFYSYADQTGIGKAAETGEKPASDEIEKMILPLMEEGKIPGLSIVIIKGNEPVLIKNFGYADLENKTPVTPGTRFELASCSKAFTAVAALQLAERGLINLDDPVSKYIPGFFAKYQDQEYDITLRQLLHHTSGISWKSISLIPVDNSPEALQNTARKLIGTRLDSKPGERFQYATINYDVVGAVIEIASEQGFEDYMKYYVFTPLGLTGTSVGVNPDQKDPLKAKGYKLGFWKPRLYEPPVFRGNNPAGYIVSNSEDIARWLQFQLELKQTDLNHLLQKTHLRDKTVSPDTSAVSSYAMGWHVSLRGDGQVSHSGANPNFTSYISMRPQKKIAVAVMINSNSSYTAIIGNYVMKHLAGESLPQIQPTSDKTDTVCSIFSFVLGAYLLLSILLILSSIIGFFKGKNKFEGLTWKKVEKLVGAALLFAPYIVGIYLLPKATTGVTWDTALVWGPVTIHVVVVLILVAFSITVFRFFISLILPNRNKYLNAIPMVALLGIISGLSNTAILFLITTSFYSPMALGYLIYYFLIMFLLFTFGNKVVGTKMIKITNNITLDLRTDLVNKVIISRYQNFEKLDAGRLLTTLNSDTTVIAGSAGMLVGGITSFITALSAFIYLTSISVEATLVVFVVVIIMSTYYYIISKISRRFMEEARDTQNVYMGLLDDLFRGFRELSLHFLKRKEYREDLLSTCRQYCRANISAAIKFLNSSIIGNSFIMIMLGTLSIVVPRVLTGVKTITLISYIMVLLYLIGPINGLLGLIPGITRIKVSWDRITGFKRTLDNEVEPESANQLIKNLNAPDSEERFKLKLVDQNEGKPVIDSIKIEGVKFQYENDSDGRDPFSVGPINQEIKRGEVLFIIGGNGSGKSTLARLIAGLYLPDEGTVKINGVEVTDTQLGEYYSTVLDSVHVFRKIYEVDAQNRVEEIRNYLKRFTLDKVVQLEGNEYSNIRVSQGQRQRMALIQCFLEDRPIFLFDEFAANQDPQFRRYFYRELLPVLKEQGKIIIAVTHDDHYFDVADKIIKLDMGKVDTVEADYRTTN
jgi:putative ATP-binding cassette transporter